MRKIEILKKIIFIFVKLLNMYKNIDNVVNEEFQNSDSEVWDSLFEDLISDTTKIWITDILRDNYSYREDDNLEKQNTFLISEKLWKQWKNILFEDEYSCVYTSNKLYFLLNKLTKEILECDTFYYEKFWFLNIKWKKCWFLHEDNGRIIPYKYDEIFYDGKYWFKVRKWDKYWFINLDFEDLVQCEYDENYSLWRILI